MSKGVDFKDKLKGLSREDLVSLCCQQHAKFKQVKGFKRLAGSYLEKNRRLEAELKKLREPDTKTTPNDPPKSPNRHYELLQACIAEKKGLVREIELLKATHPRFQWKPNDKVEVKLSKSGWTQALITNIYQDKQGDWVVCRTMSGDEKEACRLDADIIRPKPLGAMDEDDVQQLPQVKQLLGELEGLRQVKAQQDEHLKSLQLQLKQTSDKLRGESSVGGSDESAETKETQAEKMDEELGAKDGQVQTLLQKVRDENESLKVRLADAESNKEQVEGQVERLEAKLQQVVQENHKLKARFAEAEQEATEQLSESSSQGRDQPAQQQQGDEGEKEREETKQRLKEALDEAKLLNVKNEELEKGKLEEERKHKDEIETMRRQTKSEVSMVKERMSVSVEKARLEGLELQRRAHTLEQQLEESNKSKQELQESLKAFKSGEGAMEAKVAEWTSKLEETAKENKLLKRALRKLQKERETLKKEISKLQSTHDESKTMANDHADAVSELTKQHENEKAALERRLFESEQWLKSQLDELKHTNLEQLKQKERLIEELGQKIELLQSQLQGVRRHMQEERVQHQSSMDQITKRMEGLRRNHSEMIRAVEQQSEEEKGVLEAEIDQLKRQRGLRESEVERWRTEVERAHQRLERNAKVELEVEKLTAKLEASGENLRSLTRKQNNLNQMLARKERQIETLRNKLSNAESRAKSLESAAANDSKHNDNNKRPASDSKELSFEDPIDFSGSNATTSQEAYELRRQLLSRDALLKSIQKELEFTKIEASKGISKGDMHYLKNVFIMYLEKKDNHGPDLLNSICKVLKLDEVEVKRIKEAQSGSWMSGIKGMTQGIF